MALHRIVRFLVVGSVNTLVTIAIYQVLLLVTGHVPAYTVAYLLGVAFSYRMYAKHVFAAQTSGRAFAAFALFYITCGVVGGWINSTLIDSFGVHARLAILLTVAVMLPVNFLGSRAIITRPREVV